MNAERTILAAGIRSTRGALRSSLQLRVVAVLGALFQLGLAAWFALWLTGKIELWRAAGGETLRHELWLVLVKLWGAAAGLTLLDALRGSFDDERTLLLTLPLRPATLLRSLFLVMLYRNFSLWMLLLGAGLLGALGWQALGWVLLLALGVATAVLGALVGAHLFIARGAAGLRTLAPATAWLLALLPSGLALGRAPPALQAGLLAALLLLGLGPLSATLGRLYLAAFYRLQRRGQAQLPPTPPGIGLLARRLARRPGLTSALIAKELLNQSRNRLNWGRMAMLLLFSGLSTLLLPWLRGLGLSDRLILAGIGAGMATLTLIEIAPSPIGSEGDRLALYLSAPIPIERLLWAKLAVFLTPLAGFALLLAGALGLWLGLPALQLAGALLDTLLLVSGAAAVIIWGSAWDADLSLSIEGPLQMLLHEQVPGTPRRIWLLQLSLLTLAGGLLLLWQLPAPWSTLALAALNLLLCAGLLRFARGYLRTLLR